MFTKGVGSPWWPKKHARASAGCTNEATRCSKSEVTRQPTATTGIPEKLRENISTSFPGKPSQGRLQGDSIMWQHTLICGN